MARIGTIDIGMRVATGGLTAGIAKARGLLGGFGGQLAGIGRGVAGLGSGIASGVASLSGLGGILGAGSIAGLGALAARSMDTVDATAKLADRLGASTEGLVGLQHAAGLAGADSGLLNTALEKMGVNLSKATRNAHAADVEGTAAASAFAALGLNAKEAISNDAIDNFRLIAEGLGKIKDPAERASRAVQIFGGAGAKLGNLLNSGGAGIDAAIEEAKRLGLTYSREEAALIENANDAKARLAAIFTGIGNQIAIGAAPAIDWLAKNMMEVGVQGLAMGRSLIAALAPVGKLISRGIAPALALVETGIEVLGVVTRNLGAIFEEIGVRAGGAITNLGETFSWLQANIATILDWVGTNWRTIFTDAFGAVTTALINLGQNFRDFGKSAYDWIASGFTRPFELKITPIMEGFRASTTALVAPELKLSSVDDQVQAIRDRVLADEEKRLTIQARTEAKATEIATAADALATDALATDPVAPAGGEVKLAGAAAAGSAEAYSTLARFFAGGEGQDDSAKSTAQNTRAIASDTREQTSLLRRIAEQRGTLKTAPI